MQATPDNNHQVDKLNWYFVRPRLAIILSRDYQPKIVTNTTARMPARTIGVVSSRRRRLGAGIRVTNQKMTIFSSNPTSVARNIAIAADEPARCPLLSCWPTSTEEDAALANAPTTTTTRKPMVPNRRFATSLITVNQRNSMPKPSTERNSRGDLSCRFCGASCSSCWGASCFDLLEPMVAKSATIPAASIIGTNTITVLTLA